MMKNKRVPSPFMFEATHSGGQTPDKRSAIGHTISGMQPSERTLQLGTFVSRIHLFQLTPPVRPSSYFLLLTSVLRAQKESVGHKEDVRLLRPCPPTFIWCLLMGLAVQRAPPLSITFTPQ